MKFSRGDILIDRKTLRHYPIIEVGDGCVYLELGHRKAKRAIGQIIRLQKKFIILRVGQTLSTDHAFYCPKNNRIIVLKKGTVFMGEV